MLVTFISPLVPEGNFFGTRTDDEFSVTLDDIMSGIFKRFEYLSLPTSLALGPERMGAILDVARLRAESIDEFEAKDAFLRQRNTQFLSRLSSAGFAKQVLESGLAVSYLVDDAVARLPEPTTFEGAVALAAAAWRGMADFYCIEGLVGGTGERNPFRTATGTSLVAGAVDVFEQTLPALRTALDADAWRALTVQLGSLVGRRFEDVDAATDILRQVHGVATLAPGAVQDLCGLAVEAVGSPLETPADVAKRVNSVIRFHNWLRAEHGADADMYDSVCAPAKAALARCPDGDVVAELGHIKGATSPKGVALIARSQEGRLGDAIRIHDEAVQIDAAVKALVHNVERSVPTLALGDATYSAGLGGGKWRGLRMLEEARRAFALSYTVPDAFVITAPAIRHTLRSAGMDIEKLLLAPLTEDMRKRCVDIVHSVDFTSLIDRPLPSADIMVRSSMLGEDGESNFSGTYHSERTKPENMNSSIVAVVSSYFGKEAVRSREDLGMSNLPGISVIVQARARGVGGVLHMTGGGYSISIAVDPEEAVRGQGSHREAASLTELLSNTALQPFTNDMRKVHETFGNVDVEFVIDGTLYCTQLRPKAEIAASARVHPEATVTIESPGQLAAIRLHVPSVLRLPQLHAAPEAYESVLFDFMRANKGKVALVEGSMPVVAHLPNKIEGHFRVPYTTIGGLRHND